MMNSYISTFICLLLFSTSSYLQNEAYLIDFSNNFSESLVKAGEQELSLLSPNGGEFWQVGKSPTIYWESKNIINVTLEYSADNGNSWNDIATLPAKHKSYVWTIPNSPSSDCLLKISSKNSSDVSEENFEISSDNTTCRIVVLGSSTAEGTGPSSPDSAWVNRYSRYLNYNTRFEVINLAKGGYTTYHILPTDSEIPSGVNISVDEKRNFTKALSYNPSAIIINMPSNDAAKNITPRDQMDNFRLIRNTAAEHGIRSWICTTQPRNFPKMDQIDIQTQTRDSIFQYFGNYAIDFWNEIAEESNGYIKSEYDSGDGIHLNNAGHAILIERVKNAEIDTLNCGME